MKKCLVLDLDNTLWGGVIGEEGMDHIDLSLEAPGNSFLAFQQAILDLYNNGVILAINSKNNPEDALKAIREHPNMVLREKHFAAMRMNWNDKVSNMRELAEVLNIGLDSFVFLDDDKLNREMVRSALPMVLVPDLPENPQEYAQFLMSLNCFPEQAVTDEDKMRGNYYVTERLRIESEKSFTSPDEFLKSLNLEVVMRKNQKDNLIRLSQITEKTNQFNFLKKEISIEDMEKYIDDENVDVWEIKVRDRFGDYGLTGLVLVEKQSGTHRILNMMLSCRVLGRDVERAVVDAVEKEAKSQNSTLSSNFKKSEKNKPAESFVSEIFDYEDGEYKLTRPVVVPEWITVKYG